MSKDYANKKCVTNPVDASQVKNVASALEWGGLTPPVCTDLINTLQTILDVINQNQDVTFVLSCLNVDNDRDSILQELINKECETSSESQSEYDILEQEGLPINFCEPEIFTCESEVCINVTTCNETNTLVEQVQALTSRVIGLSQLVLDQCVKIEELETDIAEIKLDNDCCDTSGIENRLTLMESNLTTINNTCCP